nr:uncharacterized protein LOC107377186 isoform X1 [Nothobranchius furzeri]
MANFLQLPLSKCHYSDHSTGTYCDGHPPFHVKSRPRCTALIIEWFCPRGHKLWSWNSQPKLKYGMQGGDFMLSTNILLSGNNFSKIALLFRFMNIRMVTSKTFYSVQGTYCLKSIQQFWEEKRNAIIKKLQSKDRVVALADGRMDSPGHSAMCCTYTTMDLDTMDIISVVNVDKRWVGYKSGVMEKAAFIQTFDSLTKEVNIKEIVTDAHVQIAALMHPERGRYKDQAITHSLDVWHAAKNLTKKLHAVGMISGQKLILGWIKDIVNHFWYACQHTSTREEFMDVWKGVLHHVTGEHEWGFGRCFHAPLAENPDKELIPHGSAAHVALSRIVLNQRWLKDIEKLLTFRTTAELESFQNHILMYAGKRFAFSFGVYEARTLLAALDYNHHNHRPVHVNIKGQVSHKRVYNKKSQRYSVHTVKETKDYGYIPELQTRILEKRLSSAGGLPKRRSVQADDPRALGPLSGISPPPTAELVQTQQRRGQVVIITKSPLHFCGRKLHKCNFCFLQDLPPNSTTSAPLRSAPTRTPEQNRSRCSQSE